MPPVPPAFQSPQPNQPQEPEKKSYLPLIIGIILFVLVAIVLIGWLMFSVFQRNPFDDSPAEIGEVVQTQGLSFELDQVQKTEGSEYFQAQEGYQYVLCYLNITNETNQVFNTSDLKFYLEADGKSYEPYSIPGLIITELESKLEPNSSDSGVLEFEVPPVSEYTLNIYNKEDVKLQSFTFTTDRLSTLDIDELPEAGLIGEEAIEYDGEAANVGDSVVAANGVTYTVLDSYYTTDKENGLIFLHCLVSIQNTSSTLKTYNAYDWMIVYPDGTQQHVTYSTTGGEGDDLKGGNLVLDQSVMGLVNFEITETEDLQLRVYTNTFSYDEPLAVWSIPNFQP